MSGVSRRRFLTATSLTVGGFLTVGGRAPGWATQAGRARKDINTLNDSQIENYIHALDVLRLRSEMNPDDEAGYDFQAGLHNDGFIGPCEHGNDHFLAWHRAHLHYFEELLRAADPPRTADVTIPYWDWLHAEESGKFPAAFTRQGLAMDDRNERPAELPPDTLSIVTGERDWNAFGGFPKGSQLGDYGDLELGPHNTMHGFFIGGRMANPSRAAEDPIYWSFHAFIDLLWAEWQRRNRMPAPTSPEADLRGFLGKPKHKIRDFQSTADLGYEYEYTEKLREAFGMGQTPPDRRDLIASERLRPLFTDSLSDELQSSARAQYALPALPAAARTAAVRLQNLKVPTTGSYMLRAYLHPEGVAFRTDDPQFRDQYGVGYVTLWMAHGEDPGHNHRAQAGDRAPQPHHPTECTVRFDVTKRLVGLEPREVEDLVLTLHYIPAPDSTGKPRPDGELVREVQLRDVMLEAYGER